MDLETVRERIPDTTGELHHGRDLRLPGPRPPDAARILLEAARATA
ncbi:hypothetical protein GCM10010406_49320 [Streptomyces thermolineatus]|uniref:Uncharacterized protein n=1 Tax=Streptomyces thermolineatus TaxID=44033 RepID=A0ABP6A244_9ACTN